MANDQEVKITLTADSKSVEAAQAKILRNLDMMADKLTEVGKKSKESSKATEDGLAAGASQAMKFVGAITGVGTAVGGILAIANQLKREYDNMVSRQKEAAGAQVGFESQLAEAVRNAAGLLTGDEVKKESLRIAGAASADPASVAAALSSTLSAVGPTNKAQAQQAFVATEAAMRFAPEMSGPDIAALAGTAVDIAKRTGATPQQAIGFLQNIGGVARVPSLQNLSGNVAPAVMGVTQFGGDIKDSAALVSALTQGMADTEGRVSGTASLALAEQLRERLPKLGSTRERIEAIAANKSLFKAFFEGGSFGGKKFEPASFEKKALPSIEQLLTKDSMLNRAFLDGAEKIGDVKSGGQKTFDDLLREVNSVTFTGRLKRTFQSATQEQQILDTQGGVTSVSREGLRAFLKSIGAQDLTQRIEGIAFEGRTMAGSAPIDVVAQNLRNRSASMQRRRDAVTGGMGVDVGFDTPAYEPSPAEKRQAEAIDRLATQLEQLSKDLKENTKATSENTKVNPSPAQRSSPVPSSGLSRRN